MHILTKPREADTENGRSSRLWPHWLPYRAQLAHFATDVYT